MPESRSPFEVLGLTPGFALDPGDIERAFLARSVAVHPDLADPAQAADAARAAAALNHARQTLADPERRASALLADLGGPTASEDKSLPDGFLMEILETRMEIEGDIGDPARRAHWESWAEGQRGGFIDRVGSAFGALADLPPADAVAAIRQELNAWRYIERLIEQLDPDYDPARADFSD